MGNLKQPDQSEGEILPVETLGNAIVQRGIGQWRGLMSDQPYPARDQITPRTLGTTMHIVILVRVLAEDY